MNIKKFRSALISGFMAVSLAASAWSQVPPTLKDEASYQGLHAAASKGDVGRIQKLVKAGADLEARDRAGRTPLHVAVFKSHDKAFGVLVAAGADVNALENSAYDAITIAAVADDLEMMNRAIEAGGNPGAITSPYEGTALIAAAHLGHAEVVKSLVDAGAPLDHVNNLGWTALIEVVVLGDGGERHLKSAQHLLKAGADRSIADRQGVTPLAHARQMGYTEMVKLFEATAR